MHVFTYVFGTLSILQSQFTEKGFKKAENLKQKVVLLFLFTLELCEKQHAWIHPFELRLWSLLVPFCSNVTNNIPQYIRGSDTFTHEIGVGLKIVNKLVRYSSHHSFLNAYLRKHITPKGMHLSFPFTGLPDSLMLVNRIKTVLASMEASIIHVCIEHYKNTIKDLQQQLQADKTSVKTKAGESDYHKFLSYLDRKKLSLERTCEATKRKKLSALRKKSKISENGNVNWQNSYTEYTVKT